MKTKNKGGRKGLLNTRMISRVAKAIAEGNTARTACLTCGISERVFFKWQADGEAGISPLTVQFVQAIKEAKAKAEAVHVRNIKKASSTHWQASAWFLERTNPEDWGRKDRIRQEISGPEGAPVEVEVGIDLNHATNVVFDTLKQQAREEIERERENAEH